MISGTGKPHISGYTLIELLVVLAIIVGLAAAFPLARDRLDPSRSVKGYAAILESDLRALRSEARERGQPTHLVLEDDPHRYRLEPENREAILPDAIALHAQSDGPSAEAPKTLTFFPDGSSSGGLLKLSRTGLEIQIRVSPLTGRAVPE